MNKVKFSFLIVVVIFAFIFASGRCCSAQDAVSGSSPKAEQGAPQGAQQPTQQPATQQPQVGWPQTPQQQPAAQVIAFDVYTFKQNSTVKIGYPRGWTVTENELGVSIAENQSNTTAGVDVLVGSLQANLNTKETFANYMLGAFKQNVFPDLKVVQQAPHPQAPDVLVIDTIFTSAQGIPYKCHIWVSVNPQALIGVFTAFYAPESRYNSFNVDNILVNCLNPLFGAK